MAYHDYLTTDDKAYLGVERFYVLCTASLCALCTDIIITLICVITSTIHTVLVTRITTEPGAD